MGPREIRGRTLGASVPLVGRETEPCETWGRAVSTAMEATESRSGTECMEPGFEGPQPCITRRGVKPLVGAAGRRHVWAIPGMTGTEKAPTVRRARR